MAVAVRVEDEALSRLPEELVAANLSVLPAEMLVEKVAEMGPAALTAVKHTLVAHMRIQKEWGL